MLLKELAAEAGARLIGDGEIEISAVEQDSRAVVPGTLFVAVPGFTVDGHAYLGRAVENGAPAVAVQEDREALWRPLLEVGGVDLLVLPDTRAGLARLAAAFYGYPSRRLKVVGVTGTDGKTSLCDLIAHVLNESGRRTGLISTAECRIGGELLPDTGRFTTPEAPQVQAMLAVMAGAGCDWAVVEATSHGLALHRVDECDYDIAAFTNLGQDHIDFHGSAEEYRDAKGRLFQLLDAAADKGIRKTAVLNADDLASDYYRTLTASRAVTYGLTGGDFTARDVAGQGWGMHFTLVTPYGEREVRLPKPGAFNVLNALAAAAAGLAAGLTLDSIVPALESWPGAPGRMERIDCGQPFTVVVDFAHAAASLERVLKLLRETNPGGRVIAVFGCIGERDKDRRPGMARAAAAHADYTFITDDNPYSEDRNAILADIAEGMRAAGKREGHDFSVVPDRREAISQALSMAVDEDAVLLAGKGHETTVHIGSAEYPCDDREVARRVLGELGYGQRRP